MTIETILADRRAQREALIARAKGFAAHLDPNLMVQGVVVFGSVARGDFNVWSDVDLVVIAENLPPSPRDRLAALGPAPGLVQAVPWTPDEFRQKLARSDPIAQESVERGVWLVGGARDLVAS